MRRWVAFAVLVVVIAAPLAAAQAQSSAVDFTLGIGTGWGGRYFDRAALTAELTIVPDHGSYRLASFTVGARATPASSDICVFESGVGSACLRRFPALVHMGVLGGVEQTFSFTTVENEGVAPDIDVENWPKDVVAGRDAQLERATQEAMRLLREHPVRRDMKEPAPSEWGKRKP
ncbi:MAG: peptidase [Gemmatimonadetes bacterium]|nr:peptidase [Gemmatimonadota bacterium]